MNEVGSQAAQDSADVEEMYQSGAINEATRNGILTRLANTDTAKATIVQNLEIAEPAQALEESTSIPGAIPDPAPVNYGLIGSGVGSGGFVDRR